MFVYINDQSRVFSLWHKGRVKKIVEFSTRRLTRVSEWTKTFKFGLNFDHFEEKNVFLAQKITNLENDRCVANYMWSFVG